MTTGFRVPSERKVFASTTAAYYAIAKKLVLAKYPPQMFRDDDADEAVDAKWRGVRLDKGLRLFYRVGMLDGAGDPAEFFDDRKWSAFIRRVARYLKFVDQRRGDAGVLRDLHTGLLAAEEAALLERTFQDTLSRAENLMAFAWAIRAELHRRAREEA